jgi:putative endonuclease
MEAVFFPMSPSGPKQRLGRWGEILAAKFLVGEGYRVLGQNVRTPYGEIDLMVEKDGVTVFVEVKTRSGTGFGLPEEAITRAKREHILAAIAFYWQQEERQMTDWRVDVVAVIRPPNGEEVEVVHFENAIG